MSKFLYITDQNEYDDHSFIGPLFQKYLTKHFDINTTFLSKEKTQIEIKENGYNEETEKEVVINEISEKISMPVITLDSFDETTLTYLNELGQNYFRNK